MSGSLIALVVATAVLVAIPGPNVALIVANSLKYGFRMGMVTVLGTTVGLAAQLVLVVSGVSALVALAAGALTWIKWGGVVYLIYLGVRAWREPPDDLSAISAAPAMFWQGCAIAVLNPKTLLFHAAFLPQFVAADAALVGNLAIVAAVFIVVVLVGDMLWAALAGSAGRVFRRFRHARNRVTGGFLVVAGTSLGLANR